MQGVEARNIVSVADVNKYIRILISSDEKLSGLWVKGELSNFKLHSSGHMYFTLKDESALLKCVMFKGFGGKLKFRPESGMKVVIKGNISVYERDGQYQLYAEYMEPEGMGSLHVAFEQLKKDLGAKGYFEEGRKKKTPFMPDRICVLTSPTGSVIRDILNVLERRFPQVNLCVLPVPVQGVNAASKIKRAIELANEKMIADVLILARGGGSLEELWPFNEVEVADGIFNSQIPIISAVGHETDFTISDFVADLRAPTPSAAAELVMPEKLALENKVMSLKNNLYNALANLTKVKKSHLDALVGRSVFRQPFNIIDNHRIRLDNLVKLMITYEENYLNQKVANLAHISGRLDALSPLAVLSRGYGVVRSKSDGRLVNTVDSVSEGDKLEVRVKDGAFCCEVEEKC